MPQLPRGTLCTGGDLAPGLPASNGRAPAGTRDAAECVASAAADVPTPLTRLRATHPPAGLSRVKKPLPVSVKWVDTVGEQPWSAQGRAGRRPARQGQQRSLRRMCQVLRWAVALTGRSGQLVLPVAGPHPDGGHQNVI